MNRYTLSAAFGIVIGLAAAFVVAGGGNGRPTGTRSPAMGVVRPELRYDTGGYDPNPPIPPVIYQPVTAPGNAIPVATGFNDHLGRPILFGAEHLAR